MIFKNKKGFTLVELIAVIAIIGILSTIAVVSFSTISKRTKEKEYEAIVGSIKVPSYNFYDATQLKKFYVQTLIDYGLLGTDNNTYEIINPINDEAMNCYIVYISDDNFRLEENNDCSKDLYKSTKPTITYCNGDEYNSSVWHNDTSLCLKASLHEVFKDYEVDEISWGNKNDGNFIIKSPQLNLKFDDNSINEEIYTVRIKLKDDTITVANADIIVKNDLKKPEVKSFTVVNNNGKNYNSTNVKYEINASDVKSGVQYYCFNETDNPLSCNWVEANTGSYKINKEDGIGGIFLSYAFAKDAAGNISKAFKNEFRLYKTCSELIYEDGTKCSSSCNGTYNRLAYDKYFNVRCEKFDTQSGGSSCSESNCSYTITYNANGGKNAPDTGIKTKGVDYKIPDEVPTRSGYTFDSWNTDEYGTGTEYKKGDLYKTDANLTLYAQWSCTMEYRCSTDGNYQSRCANGSWTNTGSKCTKKCTNTGCSKPCGGGTMITTCYYELNGYKSDSVSSTTQCNTNSCSKDNFDCNVQGSYIINTKKYDRLRNPWECDAEDTKKHIEYQQHTTAYIHYCCLKDANGDTLLDSEHCYRRKDMIDKFNITTYNYICSCMPYNNSHGWKMLNDNWIPINMRDVYETDCK